MTYALEQTFSPSFSSVWRGFQSATTGSQLPADNQETSGKPTLPVGRMITQLAAGYIDKLILTAPNQFAPSYIPVPISIMQIAGGNREPASSELCEIPSVADCLARIVELSGLNKTQVAERLLGVTRQAPYYWTQQRGIKSENLEKLLAIKDVLERAKENQAAGPEAPDLHWWLLQPRGESGITPQELILKGDLARARLYAMATAPRKRTARPEWLRGKRNQPETERIQRILDSYSEGDYNSPIDPDDRRG